MSCRRPVRGPTCGAPLCTALMRLAAACMAASSGTVSKQHQPAVHRIFGGAHLELLGRGKTRTTFKDIAGIDQVLPLSFSDSSQHSVSLQGVAARDCPTLIWEHAHMLLLPTTDAVSTNTSSVYLTAT